MVMSAVSPVSTPGVLVTMMPRSCAAARSIWSTPAPKLASSLSPGPAASRHSASMRSVTVGTSTSARPMASSSSARSHCRSLSFSSVRNSSIMRVSTASGSLRVTMTSGLGRVDTGPGAYGPVAQDGKAPKARRPAMRETGTVPSMPKRSSKPRERSPPRGRLRSPRFGKAPSGPGPKPPPRISAPSGCRRRSVRAQRLGYACRWSMTSGGPGNAPPGLQWSTSRRRGRLHPGRCEPDDPRVLSCIVSEA